MMGAMFAQFEPVETLETVQAIDTPTIDWVGLLPVLLVGAGALVLLMVRSLVPSRHLPAIADALWTFLLAAAGIVTLAVLWQRDGDVAAFGGHFVYDGRALFVSGVVLASVCMVVPTLPRFCRRVGIAGSELYVLTLLAAAGALVMAGANDLIVLFLGLETMSIAAYVMAALNLRRLESLEAGIKYFVLGAFSTAFLLYGIALVYGATGTTSLTGIADYLRAFILFEDAMLLAGIAMLVVGLGFKVAAVPFHSWAPDVYAGAPTPVTALMASAVKAAGFAVALSVLTVALGPRAEDWQPPVFALACATLVVGSVLAAVQGDLKRLLAYSSVSHAGFILVGVQAASEEGAAGVLFYLAAYSVMAVGSFTVVASLSGERDDRTAMEVVTGLGGRRPVLALGLTILLLAQAGVPFTSGFVAKFSVISAAAEAESYWLAVVAMLSAVVAAFAYLRVVVAMYFRGGDDDAEDEAVEPMGAGAATIIALAAAVTVIVGVLPSELESLARSAAGH